MGIEILDHFLVATFGYADFVLSDEFEDFCIVEFFEFAAWSATHGALFGCLVTFVYIATNGADKFFLH